MRMGEVPGAYITAALVPAILITILFYFDHSVSSQLAQLPEFNLVKPSAYNYDFALLGVITIVFGLIGLPPINGVLPQAPMHTRSLITVKENATLSRLRKVANKHEGERRSAALRAVAARAEELGSTTAPFIYRLADKTAAEELERGDQGAEADSCVAHGPQSSKHSWNAMDDKMANGQPQPAPDCADAPGEGKLHNGHNHRSDAAGLTASAIVDVDHEIGPSWVTQVSEQRVSNLIQSCLCGLCVGITPGIKLIPSPILWGYFAFMAIDSLPGSQFWDRLLLLGTDRSKFFQLKGEDRPYLGTVPTRTIALFTILQVLALGAVYGYTWAGIAGIAFPVFIMALVPIRRFILPRFIKKRHLQHLDPAPYEKYGNDSSDGADGDHSKTAELRNSTERRPAISPIEVPSTR